MPVSNIEKEIPKDEKGNIESRILENKQNIKKISRKFPVYIIMIFLRIFLCRKPIQYSHLNDSGCDIFYFGIFFIIFIVFVCNKCVFIYLFIYNIIIVFCFEIFVSFNDFFSINSPFSLDNSGFEKSFDGP